MINYILYRCTPVYTHISTLQCMDITTHSNTPLLHTHTQVDKVQYISHIRELPTAVRRNAELALFCHQPQQAEAIYLQAGMVYRAIELNISLFNWER